MTPIYHRILLKLSGESLAAEQSSGIDPQRVADYATQIKEIVDAGVQVAIVVEAVTSSVASRVLLKALIALKATRWVCLPQ